MVPRGGRHATSGLWIIVEAAVGAVLLFAEREEIALLRAQGHGVREIARRLERTASTISREDQKAQSCGIAR